jgi:hypothetical protein
MNNNRQQIAVTSATMRRLRPLTFSTPSIPDDDTEPITANGNEETEEISAEREPFQIEITGQEYADYLKWKRQTAKGRSEM